MDVVAAIGSPQLVQPVAASDAGVGDGQPVPGQPLQQQPQPPNPNGGENNNASLKRDREDEDVGGGVEGGDDGDGNKTSGRGASRSNVWKHIDVNLLEDGINEQVCKYCSKTKNSKQLQTTFWAKHLVDTSRKGCPNCPTDIREELAQKTRSATVQKAAGKAPIIKTDQAFKRAKKKMALAAEGKPTIICMCGSSRTGSYNKMLLNAAMSRLVMEGANIQEIDLKALNLPLYDPDRDSTETFLPAAQQFKNMLTAADGIFFTCPEYNGFITPLLLNAITWATRGEGRPYAAFKNKVVCTLSASQGVMGGMRMLRSLSQMMQDMGAIVVPGNNGIGNAFHVFDREGTVVDERASKKILVACHQMVHLTTLHAARDTSDPMEAEIHKLSAMGEYGRADW